MTAPSSRMRVLAAIVRRGRIDNPHELQLDAGTNTHHVVHLLYGLRDAGLIEFRTGKPPTWKGKPQTGSITRQVPTRIRPTIAGIKAIDGDSYGKVIP